MKKNVNFPWILKAIPVTAILGRCVHCIFYSIRCKWELFRAIFCLQINHILQNKCVYHLHTCDTFLNPNREIWNFWSGNLCLVSGGFHVANFGPFLPKLKSRNLVTLLEICYRASQCQHMPTEVRICVRLQFKKPPLILF